jgi:hypothetical protein
MLRRCLSREEAVRRVGRGFTHDYRWVNAGRNVRMLSLCRRQIQLCQQSDEHYFRGNLWLFVVVPDERCMQDELIIVQQRSQHASLISNLLALLIILQTQHTHTPYFPPRRKYRCLISRSPFHIPLHKINHITMTLTPHSR